MVSERSFENVIKILKFDFHMIVLMFYFKIFINYLCDLKSYMYYMTY